MKRLTLIRHAQADNPLPDQQDWHRPLTKRGQRDAKEMSRRLKEQQPRPEIILSSPAIRAKQTAEIFAACFAKAELVMNEELYLAEPKNLLAAIQQLGDVADHLILVGHNPGISELADQLSKDRRIEGMPTASIVTMEFSITTWQALLPATGINVDFDYPQRPA